MNQDHFLNKLFKKVKRGPLKGTLVPINFRKRPERYETKSSKPILCRECRTVMATVRSGSTATSGICFVCFRRGNQILVESLREIGVNTRQERKKFLRANASK